jgi:hypothetical protein
MEAFVIDDEELSKHYSGLCLRRATAISTRACHVGHGLRLVSAIGMLYNAGHCPHGTHTPDDAKRCWPTVTVLKEPPGFSGLLTPHMAVDERASGVGAGNLYGVLLRVCGG